MSRRKGIMLCYPLEEKRLEKWNSWPVICQPKLDGLRCKAEISKDGQVFLVSSEENPFFSVPHINQALKDRKELWGRTLDGELYSKKLTFEQLCAVCLRDSPVKESSMVRYFIFDEMSDRPQGERLLKLRKFSAYDRGYPLQILQFDLAEDISEVYELLNEYLDLGYEGIIVRHPFGKYIEKRSTEILKFKPRKMDTYIILRCNEEVSISGEPKGTLGSFTCLSSNGQEFNCGSGFTDLKRKAYWNLKDLIPGKYLQVKYQQITSKGVPRFPVAYKLIGEEEAIEDFDKR